MDPRISSFTADGYPSTKISSHGSVTLEWVVQGASELKMFKNGPGPDVSELRSPNPSKSAVSRDRIELNFNVWNSPSLAVTTYLLHSITKVGPPYRSSAAFNNEEHLMKEIIAKIVFLTMLLILTTSCDSPPPSPTPSSTLPFLSATYTIGSDIYLKETTNVSSSAVFNDNVSSTRHTLVTNASPGSRPTTTNHKGSQWLAWREGNTIYAKALWWGPGNVRTVYEGGANTPTSPAMTSYNNQLVVMWGVGESLYFSRSEYGIEWQPPLSKRFAGAIVNNPTLAVHNDTLYTGAAFGYSLFTVSIKSDFTWGPNFHVLDVGSPIIPEITLASNGNQISLGYASGNQLFVIHSTTGYNNWSIPSEIESGSQYPAPPALAYYNGYLYAIYTTSTQLVMKRSPDGNNWATPRFVVDAVASSSLTAASLTSTDYSIVPLQPQVVSA